MDGARITAAEYFEDWLHNTARLNVSADVFNLYGREIHAYINPYIGTAKLGDLRPSHPSIEASLKRHRTMQNEERLKAKTWNNLRLVFPTF